MCPYLGTNDFIQYAHFKTQQGQNNTSNITVVFNANKFRYIFMLVPWFKYNVYFFIQVVSLYLTVSSLCHSTVT